MFSIESFYQTYETDTVSINIRNKPFTFLVPKSLDAFIDSSDVSDQFPLWAKIWEASLVLADHLASQQMKSKTLLELGAGLGATGIIAEKFGYQVTSTEYDSHAFQFLQANAHHNDCQTIDIKYLDWHKPQIDSPFDIIVGSELIYKESDFKPLQALFHQHLKPHGEILLAGEIRKSTKSFLDLMAQWYHIEIFRKKLRSEDTVKTILLIRLTGKTKP